MNTSQLKSFSGLYTDFYQLTMAQVYFKKQKHLATATFDYFFRKNPFESGFTVFCGLEDLIDEIENFQFDESAIEFLQNHGFEEDFLSFLRKFEFTGSIYSMQEGEIVFPNEPVLRVEANLIEAQLIETLLLNILNYESLIATKTARVVLAAKGRAVSDFGMRRAQGLGSIHGSRAAIIGGASSTSNVYSGKLFNLPVAGTMAHSFIQSYEDEHEAFKAYSDVFPENSIMLIDTYDSLKSGIQNAIKVAREMQLRGQHLVGIRLDSGDLAYLSKKVRKMLDDADLKNVKIVVSNQLDEHLIKSLLDQGAPIDMFGVGTNLITGKPNAALDGVYKLSSVDGQNRMKLSDNAEKLTLPGAKHVMRLYSEDNLFYGDVVLKTEEPAAFKVVHPSDPSKHFDAGNFRQEHLFQLVVKNGSRTAEKKSVREIKQTVQYRLEQLPDEHKRFENPHVYKVGLSEKLKRERDQLKSRYESQF
ncbi:nicotinate phosphoribosyltransferase [Salibacter halophilus]|uniref:Nicotinate phosphoribosyltransferase n=1 Tax=Salibacter halophilus TaxID=1803916 RepID=A0A6N6M447_9FLAO|nr:nicotinate phosphoribosyltransferase [Salibacter halophilus]KAB1064060.1 nicotinate phosphoribosyltransferase [Salibacter halophilus]